MAYPHPMPVSGPISQTSTIFKWWRDAIKNEDKEEGFDGFFFKKGQYLPAFPFTREAFKTWVNQRWGLITGFSYHTFDFPPHDNTWNRTAVNDWAKIKCFELALFGNTKIIDDASVTLEKFNLGNNGRYGIDIWTDHSLAYLRFALTRFSDYGECIENNNNMVDSDGDGVTGGEGGLPDFRYFVTDFASHNDGAEYCWETFSYEPVKWRKLTISIVSAEGNVVSAHPGFTFKLTDDAVVVIPDGVSSKEIIYQSTTGCQELVYPHGFTVTESSIPKFV